MRLTKKYREQKYKYGDYMEVNLYPVYFFPRGKRRKKKKPSRKCQKRLNQINAERQLSRILAANFTNEDYKLELTYSPDNLPEDIERAKKDLKNFLARMSRARKKQGLSQMKYIYSLEVGERTKRIHFHMVMSGGMKPKDIQKIWGKGYVDKVKPLMFDETGLRGIARYMCKQKVSTDGTETDAAGMKRYQCSQNCIKPQPQNNDYKFSKKKVKEIADDPENMRAIEAKYPGYFCGECKSFWNENNGEHYISIMLYRQDAELDIRNQMRRSGDNGRRRSDKQGKFTGGNSGVERKPMVQFWQS